MRDPVDAARDVLAEYEQVYGWDRGLPVPVEDIAGSLLLLHIEEADDLRVVAGRPHGEALSGLLVSASKTIWVDRREAARSGGRRRFTIAHEVGHWILHVSTAADDAMTYCRPQDLDAGDEDAGRETEANRFAAALLMPAVLVEAEAKRWSLNIPLLAKRFDVSVPAIELRLRTLELLPAWMRQ